MGMERLVRSLDDLALMLSLLPRSATGQKLSVYTQLIQSPLSHQQRHLILLDNGRSGLRNSPLKESLYCIRCGACLNACPVFRELGGHAYNSVYPGPIGSVISAGFFGPDFVPLAQASSLCGACKEACPVDIDLPKLLTRVRAGQFPIIDSRLPRNGGLSPLSSLFLRIYSRIARSPRLFAVSQRFASLAARLASPFDPWIRLPASTGWGYSKDFPRFAKTPFRLRFERLDVMSPGIQVGNPTFKPTRIGKSMQMYQDVDALISQYVEELTKVGGYITRIHPKKLTAEVIDLLKTRGLDRLHLEPNILDESALVQSGIEISSVVDPEIRVGLTKAVCGLADTGSILVVDGEGDPLQASLLPEIHIAVLDTSRILPSLADALTLPAVRESSSTVVITGPSRTSDIEMSHTIGVHGSGQVHVFLVDD
jgi:L-lactate dehydrogenase complex protein LldF